MTANFPSSAPAFGKTGFHKTSNMGESTLSGAILSGATSAVVANANNRVAWPTANFAILNVTKNELAWCSSRSGNTLTIEKGFGGTSSVAWDNGDTIRVVLESSAIQKVFEEVIAIGEYLLAGGAGLNAADNEEITGLWDFSNASGLKAGVLTERTSGGGVTFNLNGQDYKFANAFSTNLGIEAQTVGTQSAIGLYAKDGDGTDNVVIDFLAKGNFANQVNLEYLRVGYVAGSTRYEIAAGNAGTGSNRPIHIYAASSTQLVLETDGDVDMDSGVFYLDATNNRIGVNKTNPATALDVNGTVTATAFSGNGAALTGITGATGGVSNTGSTTIGADTDADGVGVIALQTRGTTRMTVQNGGTVDFTGNVGIGDSSSVFADRKLWVHGVAAEFARAGADFSLDIYRTEGTFASPTNLTGATSIGDIAWYGRINSSNLGVAIIRGYYAGDGTTQLGELRFLTSNSGNPAERVRINSAGNVGIGTTSPGRFSVQSGIASSGAGASIHLLAETGGASSNGGDIFIGAGANGSGAANGNIRFGIATANALTLSTEWMRIVGDGAVLVGGGTSILTSEMLQVRKDSTGTANVALLANLDNNNNAITRLVFQQGYTGGTQTAAAVWSGKEGTWSATAADQDGYFAIGTTLNGTLTERFRLTSGGKVVIGSTSAPNGESLRIHTSTTGENVATLITHLTLAGTSIDVSGASIATVDVTHIGGSTLTATAPKTITSAASLYINNAPAAGANVTITYPYALWVDTGNSRFDGPLHLQNQTNVVQVFHNFTEANPRFRIGLDGGLDWGAGVGNALDTNLYRSAADTLKTDDTFVVGATGASKVGIQIDGDPARPFLQRKSTTAVEAPTAGFGLLRWETGTNAGTLKLVAYSGTSTTGVTIVDNVGSGN